MQTNPNINLTMLCDFYELTMANGYFKSGMQDKITYFDLFFRPSSISRTCTSARTISRICVRAASSVRIS